MMARSEKERRQDMKNRTWMVFGLGLLLASGVLACSGDGNNTEVIDAGVSCMLSEDCLGNAAGGLCLEGQCEPCSTDEQCALDPLFGPGATCSGGECGGGCPIGQEACACYDDQTCRAGLECVAGQCTTCDRGTEACVCYGDGSCGADLLCRDGLCVGCPGGTEACPCDEGACLDGMICVEGICQIDNCVDGALDCPCDGGQCDEGLYCGAMGRCLACSADVVDCPCDEGLCEADLVCDGASDLCREAVSCSELACVEHQLCGQEAGADAECLPDCEPGFGWNEALTVCETLHANCVDGAELSILSVCTALNMACVESEDFATCSGCLEGFVPVVEGQDQAGCRLPSTCLDLEADCLEAGRLCVEGDGLDDASCGECTMGYVAVVTGQPELGCTDAIYVRAFAPVDGLGTKDDPTPDLAYGIELAASLGLSDVNLAMGTYVSDTTLDLIDGLQLHGGLEGSDWTAGGQRSLVQVNSVKAMRCRDLGLATLVENVEIQGPDAIDAGGSVYALFVRSCADLTIRNCRIVAGDAADGAPGEDLSDSSAEAGEAGTLGGPGVEYGWPWPCTMGTLPVSGIGGQSTCGAGAGGQGGAPGTGPAPGSPGDPGASVADAAGGEAGEEGMPPQQGDWNPTLPYVGKGGGNGADGQTGMYGSRSFVLTGYRPGSGLRGSAGSAAAGGGGGSGGGGGVQSCESTGGAGGGGGAGGCAGIGGFGGGGGGGSFAVYVVESQLSLVDCELVAGQGGHGAEGGPGQLGGAGGLGGRVGTTNKGNEYGGKFEQDHGSNGGRGGNGGGGGNGGLGGPGSGGHSICILSNSTTTLDLQNVDMLLGQGGSGASNGGIVAPNGQQSEQYTY